jgi:hypothetical protein
MVTQNAENYSQAVQMLSETKIIASCYYIVVGTQKNEGIVIERNRLDTYKKYELSEKNWFLV